jgi:hypothetical protein
MVNFTKSRSTQSNNKALVESKNASVVRKILDYTHITQPFALLINQFNLAVVYPYMNFHKPCAFPENIRDKKGNKIVA